MLATHVGFASPPNVVFQLLDDESVLLHLQTERYYVLNDVATRMWQLLTESGSYTNTLAGLLAEFDSDEATLRRDLDDLIARLTELQLIERTVAAG
jgi:hypothetical protein